MNLNKAMIIGNLTRDPELRNTPSGSQVASFSVATSLVWTDQAGQQQKKSEFHNIIAWKKLAEICGQYLKKGSKVYVEGRLQTTEWTGQDSVKRYKTEIVLENMIMLDAKQDGSRNTNAASTNQSSNQSGASHGGSDANVDGAVGGGWGDDVQEDEIRVENIPF